MISIHIGGCGVRLGDASWQLFCLEHGLTPTGVRDGTRQPADSSGSFFSEEEHSGRQVPLCVFADLGTEAVDEVRTGDRRGLYHPNQLISGKEDAACNFARGFYTVGRAMIDETVDQIRRLTDNCGGLQGFMIYHSLGGGTGSGFTARLMESLSTDYGKKSKIQFAVAPGSGSMVRLRPTPSPMQPPPPLQLCACVSELQFAGRGGGCRWKEWGFAPENLGTHRREVRPWQSAAW